MSKRKLSIVLASVLILVLVSTFAYAYIGPQLGSRNMSYGMIGGDVQQLQKLLNQEGFSVGSADGIFGPKTKTGVINFQRTRGLSPDGIAGPKTLGALNGVVPVGSNSGSSGKENSQSSGKSLDTIMREKGISATNPGLKIVVNKSGHSLSVYSGTVFLKSYQVGLGDSGLGDKAVAGDHKTPEGSFYITEKSVLSPTDQYLGTRWMRLSYPNIEDAQRGLNNSLIDKATYDSIVSAINKGQTPPQRTALGGGVGIHGGDDNNGPGDWTWGCVGLSNGAVNELYNYVSVGTKVIIQH